MFAVEKVTTIERYCPNGHTLLPDLLAQSRHPVRFCRICGLSVKERQMPYDAAYCAVCNNHVHPIWNYCPYCGQGRKD